MRPNLQFPLNFVTFTEKILNVKVHFLCSVRSAETGEREKTFYVHFSTFWRNSRRIFHKIQNTRISRKKGTPKSVIPNFFGLLALRKVAVDALQVSNEQGFSDKHNAFQLLGILVVILQVNLNSGVANESSVMTLLFCIEY